MKIFFIFIRIITVGLVWSIFFLEGVRVIMLKNWRFDIIRVEHWEYARDLWLSGWVISDAKEWAFVLILLTFIPLWLTGWASLSMIPYSKILFKIIALPLRIIRGMVSSKTRQVANKIAVKTVVKKKSYKQVRPPARDGSKAPEDSFTKSKDLRQPQRTNTAPKQKTLPPVTAAPKTKGSSFEHALFDFDDDDDDFNFDLDAPIKKEPKATKVPPKEKNKPVERNKNTEKDANKNKEAKNAKSSSVLDVIKQKGYNILNSISIKNNVIDFIGLSEDKITLFLVDKEPGDWLADEEKFNGEEPLWFSENSHRISPVRKVAIAKQHILDKLESSSLSFEVDTFVVNQMNNIINAEDMKDIWKDLKIHVTRIDRGTPKELPLLTKTLEEANNEMSKDNIEKLKKLFRSIS